MSCCPAVVAALSDPSHDDASLLALVRLSLSQEIISADIAGLHGHLNEQDKTAAAGERILRALAEGETAVPSLCLILSHADWERMQGSPTKPTSWAGRTKAALQKAASTVSLTENVYIVFLDALTLEQVPLKDGQPGYAIPTPTQFVKDHAMAIKASLSVIKLSFVAANVVGLPLHLPDTLVSSAEAVLDAVGETSDFVGDVNEALGTDVTIPTEEDMQAALNAPEENGEIVEQIKTAASKAMHPTVTEHRLSGASYRGLMEAVLRIDPSLKNLDMQAVVSADGVTAWVQKKNVEAYRTKTVLEPFDTSRWQASAHSTTAPQAGAATEGPGAGEHETANPMLSLASDYQSQVMVNADSQSTPASVTRQLDDIATQLQRLDVKLDSTQQAQQQLAAEVHRLAENQPACCSVM